MLVRERPENIVIFARGCLAFSSAGRANNSEKRVEGGKSTHW
jgi:hypothetical protein